MKKAVMNEPPFTTARANNPLHGILSTFILPEIEVRGNRGASRNDGSAPLVLEGEQHDI